MKCFEKILKDLSSRSQGLPAFDFVTKMHSKLKDLSHVFTYRLNTVDSHLLGPEEVKTGECGVAGVDTHEKTTQYKFDIGFGKLKFDVTYITIKSLAKISDYLVKNFSDNREEEDSPPKTKKVNWEYFSEKDESVKKSQGTENGDDLDDSDDFILITTSENFGHSAVSDKNAPVQFRLQTVPSPKDEMKPRFTFPAQTESSKNQEEEDDYHFGAEALFGKNQKKKFKISFQEEEHQRARCKSDTTACSRFKNILNQLKSPEAEVCNAEIFGKQQFERKNCLSPSYMNNLVINESYFGDDPSASKSRNAQNSYEDDDFNPFAVPSTVSEGSSSQGGETGENAGPVFQALREFRTSIDANDPTVEGRPNTSKFSNKHRQRKFTLSFDDNSRAQKESSQSLAQISEGTSPVFKPSSFQTGAIKEEEDVDFELTIEDEYFKDDLADFDPKMGSDLLNEEFPILSTDRNTRESTQGSHSKVGNSGENSNGLNSSEFESVLSSLQQMVSDSFMGTLNTSDDYNIFFHKIEGIRNRLDSQATDVSGDLHGEPSKKLLASSQTSEMSDAMMNNYVEIVELQQKLTGSTPDFLNDIFRA